MKKAAPAFGDGRQLFRLEKTTATAFSSRWLKAVTLSAVTLQHTISGSLSLFVTWRWVRRLLLFYPRRVTRQKPVSWWENEV
jgi:hypothetical protein